jgi:hypothetical protein
MESTKAATQGEPAISDTAVLLLMLDALRTAVDQLARIETKLDARRHGVIEVRDEVDGHWVVYWNDQRVGGPFALREMAEIHAANLRYDLQLEQRR